MAKAKASNQNDHDSLNRITAAVAVLIAAENELKINRERCTNARKRVKDAAHQLRRLILGETANYPLLAGRDVTGSDDDEDNPVIEDDEEDRDKWEDTEPANFDDWEADRWVAETGGL